MDYLLARRDEPCGRSVPKAILKAISWMEKVAEYPEEPGAWHGPLRTMSLRWSDLQAIIPAELALVEGRLVTTLRRTKTSGPNRRVRGRYLGARLLCEECLAKGRVRPAKAAR